LRRNSRKDDTRRGGDCRGRETAEGYTSALDANGVIVVQIITIRVETDIPCEELSKSNAVHSGESITRITGIYWNNGGFETACFGSGRSSFDAGKAKSEGKNCND